MIIYPFKKDLSLTGNLAENKETPSFPKLTVALSKTFTEFSSATLCFLRASSSVQRGNVSHFPNTTKSISLKQKENKGYIQIKRPIHQKDRLSTHNWKKVYGKIA